MTIQELEKQLLLQSIEEEYLAMIDACHQAGWNLTKFITHIESKIGKDDTLDQAFWTELFQDFAEALAMTEIETIDEFIEIYFLK